MVSLLVVDCGGGGGGGGSSSSGVGVGDDDGPIIIALVSFVMDCGVGAVGDDDGSNFW